MPLPGLSFRSQPAQRSTLMDRDHETYRSDEGGVPSADGARAGEVLSWESTGTSFQKFNTEPIEFLGNDQSVFRYRSKNSMVRCMAKSKELEMLWLSPS